MWLRRFVYKNDACFCKATCMYGSALIDAWFTGQSKNDRLKNWQTNQSDKYRKQSFFLISIKRTAGHLRIKPRNLHCDAHRRWKQEHMYGCWKQRHVSPVLTFEPASSSNADKFTWSLNASHNLNTERKRKCFKFCKNIEFLKEGIWFGLLSAAYQNGNQHYFNLVQRALVLKDYDLGPLRHIYLN